MNYFEWFNNRDTVSETELERLHTRQLLKLKQYTHSMNLDWYIEGSQTHQQLFQSIEQFVIKIKNVLQKREHIPNKKESKLLRKAKIKKGT